MSRFPSIPSSFVALTSPEYKKIVADELATGADPNNYHWFSGEFVTVIDK
ncbi:hypothetical protein DFH06DRAFT_1332309 [Mycena polygramma]|nr:hypothetical protein DFH06DRAFT_1332309 [Mycena polygramma]